MPTAHCPDNPTLTQLLAGRLPAEQAVVHESHLAHCSACAAKAAELMPEDDLAEALRGTDVTDETLSVSEGPMVADLIERLSGMADHPNLALLPTEDELRSLLEHPESDDELGRIGGYRVLEVLGAGGMGIVFKAEDTQLGRPVAVKVMRPQLAANRDACRRFQREACAAAAFEQNHIVTIYHVGEDHGTPFFAMQLLEGESLRSRLAHAGRLPTVDILRIGREVATGLHAAHSRGLLHRDIKPDNVWLESESEQVKIVDFGLARAADQHPSISHSGAIVGTPKYMAPEQISGVDIDERCDLFSLGSLLYHLATGEPPFSGKNVVATLVSVSQDDAAPPKSLNPALPDELSALILQLLAKDPGKRIQTAADVIERIAEIEQQLEGATLPAKPPRSRNYPRWLLAAAGGILVAAAAIIYIATNKGALVIEADDDVVVTVEAGLVLIRDRESGRQWEARIGENRVKPGVYEILLKEKNSDIVISSRELGIMRGEARRVHLSLRDELPAIAPSTSGQGTGLTKAQPSQPPPWLQDTEDTLGIEPGGPLSNMAMVTQPSSVDGVLSWTIEPVQHRSRVRDITISDDGMQIATAGDDGTVRIWDAGSRQLRNIIVCPGPVSTIAWTADGRYLATAQAGSSAGSICVWDVREDTARLVKRINRGTQYLAWSPDGRLLAFQDSGIQLWDFESGEILPSFGMIGTISRRPWSADSALLATTNNEEGILVWDVTQGKRIRSYANPGASQAVWSRHGAFIACLHAPISNIVAPRGQRRPLRFSIEIWNAAKHQRMRSFKIGESSSYANRLSWSTDESMIVTSLDDTVAVWDVRTGTKDKELPTLSGAQQVQWAADATYIASLIDGQAVLWNVEQAESTELTDSGYITLTPHSFLSQHNLLATSLSDNDSDGKATTLWDLGRLEPLVQFDEPGWMLLPTPDGTRLAAISDSRPTGYVRPGTEVSKEKEIRFYSLPDHELTGSVNVTLMQYVTAVWVPDSRHLAVGSHEWPRQIQSSMHILDGSKVVHELDGNHSGDVISWSPDSVFMALWVDGSAIIVTNANSGKPVQSFTFDHGQLGGSLAWSHDGTLLGATLDGVLKVWGITSDCRVLREFSSDKATKCSGVWFSPDGKWIATKEDASSVGVWDTEQGKRIKSIACPCSGFYHVDWSPDSQHLLFLGEHAIGAADVSTGKIQSHPFNLVPSYIALQSENTLAVSTGRNVSFFANALDLQSTLVVPATVETGLMSIEAQGAFRIGSNVAPPRIVALIDGAQHTLTPEQFNKRFSWRNVPAETKALPNED